MTSAPHPRLAEVFARVIAAPQHERHRILELECAGDDALRSEVQGVLEFDKGTDASIGLALPLIDTGRLLAAFVAADSPDLPTCERNTRYAPGTVIDHFTIDREIGQGGFGVVYLATQSPELRVVALKVLEDPTMSPRLVRRFDVERRALGRLRHPGIAQILTSGTTATGQPYFAMEFIAGADGGSPADHITKFADRRCLDIRERLALFIHVCHAVEHAHQQQIVHRDLKPSNILVEECHGSTQPKIIDFGIARRVETDPIGDLHDPKAVITLSLEVIGTPAYMSPEQAAGRHVDRRSDIYSLGVVLYELLCGTLPLPSLRLKRPATEHLRAIQDEDPEPPSRAARRLQSSDALARRCDSGRVAKQLRGDLDTILRRVLEKDSSRRFESAADLAAELQRYLDHRPINSRPAPMHYALGKLVRRYRKAVLGATLGLVALLIATGINLWSIGQARAEQRMALLMGMTANLRTAANALQTDDGGALVRALELVPEELRRWEWHYLNMSRCRLVHRITGFEANLSALAVSGDDARALVGDRSGVTTMWDLVTKQKLPFGQRNPSSIIDCSVWSVAWSPDGMHFATGSFDCVVRLYRADGTLVWSKNRIEGICYDTVYAVAFSNDGASIAVGGGDTNYKDKSFVALHRVSDGADLFVNWTAHTAAVTDLAFSPDGRWLASSADDCTVCMWRLGDAELQPTHHLVIDSEVNTIAFAPGSSWLAAGSKKGVVQLFELPSLAPGPQLGGHGDAIACVAFHSGGELLASASWDSTIRLWSIPDGLEIDVLRGHGGRANRVAFSGKDRLLSASDDETLCIRDASTVRKPRVVKVGEQAIVNVGILDDGSVVAQPQDGDVRIIDSDDGSTRHSFDVIGVEPFAICSSASALAWIAQDGLSTWRPDRGIEHHPWLPGERPKCVGTSMLDERYLLLHDIAAGLSRLDLEHDRWEVLMPPSSVPRNDQLRHLWVGDDCTLHATVWSDDHGHTTIIRGNQSTTMPEGWIAPLALAYHGPLVLLTDREKRDLVVYDLSADNRVARLVGHRERVSGAAFSPDGERLATTGIDQTLRVWDWRNNLLVLTIDYPKSDAASSGPETPRFRCVAWSPDGATLVTGSTDGTLHFFRTKR